jgi:manganese efflux pump family protein
MGFFQIILIAVSLAMDAFVVSIAAGTSGRLSSRWAAVRLSFHLGLFQFFMPIIGWFLGIKILPLIVAVDHWIAFFLLLIVGFRMIRSGMDINPRTFTADPSRGFTVVMLSLATSIDALAVGLGLAMLRVTIIYPCLVIGFITAGLSFLGIQMGNRLGMKFGKKMEIIGGLTLIVIGSRILISHLF